jgi:hypothetical protein
MNSPVPHHRPAPPRPGRRQSLESRRDALPVRRDTEHRSRPPRLTSLYGRPEVKDALEAV